MIKNRGVDSSFRLSNRVFYSVVLLSVLLALSVSVYGYGTPNPSGFGHNSREVYVDINSDGSFDKTLQQAIDDNDFGTEFGTGDSGAFQIDDSGIAFYDGDARIMGQLNMDSNRITGVSPPTSNSDVATKNYVDAAVGASTGGASTGGGAIELLGTTTCPSGWTKVYDGTMVATSQYYYSSSQDVVCSAINMPLDVTPSGDAGGYYWFNPGLQVTTSNNPDTYTKMLNLYGIRIDSYGRLANNVRYVVFKCAFCVR